MKQLRADERNWGLLVISASVLLFGAIADAADHSATWPADDWPTARAEEVGLDDAKLQEAEQYSLSAGGSGMIIRHGRVVRRWGDQAKRYDIKSATKSFGTIALGLALDDGKLDLDAPARRYHAALGVPPESNAETGWLDEIKIWHLATHTSGFEKRGGFEPLLFKPGTKWHYSDGAPNWLAECITLQYRRDLEELMFDRVFSPLGITRQDLQWRKNQYRPHTVDGLMRREFGAGIHANVDALARIGYLFLREGRWEDDQILSTEFVELARGAYKPLVGLPEHDAKTYDNASDHYGLLFWTNSDGALANVPRDAYWAWGLYDSLIVIIPSLDLVIVRGGESGKSLPRNAGDWSGHYDVLKPLLEPIVSAVKSPRIVSEVITPPYPPSPAIAGVDWEDSSYQQFGLGSDQWPLTWAADGHLYGSWGDGWGWDRANGDLKRSIGITRIEGEPPRLSAVDVWGEGPGRGFGKPEALIAIGETLYMFWTKGDSKDDDANTHAAVSRDRGESWQLDFARAFPDLPNGFRVRGICQFGPGYEGAPDEYVYVYFGQSRASEIFLARVPKDRVLEASSYEWFGGLRDDRPQWSEFPGKQAVFSDPNGYVWHIGVSYNRAVDRYFLSKPHFCPGDDRNAYRPSESGIASLGVFDAPTPWGPWTTVVYEDDFRDGLMKFTYFIPTKLISDDGRTFWLVWSGWPEYDNVNFIKGTLRLRD